MNLVKYNNYVQRYIDFIVQAKTNELEAGVKELKQHHKVSKLFPGFESHHIRPKVINGTDSFVNRVLLSSEDHKYAHFLFVLALTQLDMINEIKAIAYHGGCTQMLLTNRAFEDVHVIRTHIHTKRQELLTFKAAVKFHAVMAGVEYNVDDEKTIEVANKVLNAALTKSSSHMFRYELYIGRCCNSMSCLPTKMKTMFSTITFEFASLGCQYGVLPLYGISTFEKPPSLSIVDAFATCTKRQVSEPVSEELEAC